MSDDEEGTTQTGNSLRADRDKHWTKPGMTEIALGDAR